MPDRVVRDFPLFPLGTVALPHELVPLHIFEDRYRTMIGECLERRTEFGIVWSDDEGVRPIGCAMEITEVLERMDDGRLNILTRGTRPFRIVDERHDLPYPAGTIEFLSDKSEQPDPKTQAAAHEAYGSLVEQATDHAPDADELGAMSAYEMAATVDYLFAFAATADCVADHHFDLVFDAYLGDDTVRDFIASHNPAALKEIAERLHFSNEYYFSTFFRRQTGSTPSEFRERLRPQP